MESGNPLLDDYVLGLSGARAPAGLLSALGERRRRPLHRPLLPRLPGRPLRGQPHLALPPRAGARRPARHLLSQDLIYVGGGSVVSLLGVWRAHGIDGSCARPGSAGVVLCGLSAGSLCWFAEAVSGFHGAPRRVEGLGLLPFSNCVHYEPGVEPPPRLPRLLCARDATRLRGRGRRRAALRRHRAEPGGCLAARGRGYRLDASGTGRGDADRDHLPRRCRRVLGRSRSEGVSTAVAA